MKTFTVTDLTSFKFLSLELVFNNQVIAQILTPAIQYNRLRCIAGYVDAETNLSIGYCVCDSPTTVNVMVIRQVNKTNMYVMLRGIK